MPWSPKNVSTAGANTSLNRLAALPSLCAAAVMAVCVLPQGVAQDLPSSKMSASDPADVWAEKMLRQLTLEERLDLVHGRLTPLIPKAERPLDIAMGVGYVKGVPRLGIPSLSETDAGLGVANIGGLLRPKDYATALPSGLAMASTWNPALTEKAGAAMGAEARAKGFNVLLAGGTNLVREPRNGRNFEYAGEDPLLAGRLAGSLIHGVQSNRIASTVKHYAVNDQETGRTALSVDMGEQAMRESDLLAFELAIEVGQPASVMCSYNRVNGAYACENDFLLKDVLRRDWGYKGWVMSDWGAVHSESIRSGLDQEAGAKPTDKPYFSTMLKNDIADGTVSEQDLNRSVRRVLRSMYAVGLVQDLVHPGGTTDFEAHAQTAQTVAEEGIVLLKNDKNLLPLAQTAKRILLVGGHADVGVLAGGGSSQVDPLGGAALTLPIPGEPMYHRKMYMPSSPLGALRQQLPKSTFSYDDGTDPQRAAAAAKNADIVLLFAEQFTAEGKDVPTLSLPDDQDKLIETVAAANPNTVVILETGGPVFMPWLGRVGAVLEAWYPGQRGGAAIARILSGAVNPSGRLPVTFPQTIAQVPNPSLAGITVLKDRTGKDLYDVVPDQTFSVTYPEGADVGYRWYERQKSTPLFPFGYGLSYTTFAYSNLSLHGGPDLKASCDVTNTGKIAGTEIVQLYVVVRGTKRLAGWRRLQLQPGETRKAEIAAEPRLLGYFDVKTRMWKVTRGKYTVEVSSAVSRPQLTGTTSLSMPDIHP